jgi:hypothetical protein
MRSAGLSLSTTARAAFFVLDHERRIRNHRVVNHHDEEPALRRGTRGVGLHVRRHITRPGDLLPGDHGKRRWVGNVDRGECRDRLSLIVFEDAEVVDC